MTDIDNKNEQEKSVSGFNYELKISDSDHPLLMDLLQNPLPANDEMKKLMHLLEQD